MPIPFHCHLCDKPTSQSNGICINCSNSTNEVIYNLQSRINWLEKGLKLISTASNQQNPMHLRDVAKVYLDGEPTTADEYNTMTAEDNLHYAKKAEEMQNVVYISDINKEIAKEWKKDTTQEDEKLVFEEQFNPNNKE